MMIKWKEMLRLPFTKRSCLCYLKRDTEHPSRPRYTRRYTHALHQSVSVLQVRRLHEIVREETISFILSVVVNKRS